MSIGGRGQRVTDGGHGLRPSDPAVRGPAAWLVGVDVGVWRLATVVTRDEVLEVVEHPRAPEGTLRDLRSRSRQHLRRMSGSRPNQETDVELSAPGFGEPRRRRSDECPGGEAPPS